MPELDDVNDNVWELRDEVRELRQQVVRLERAVRAYSEQAKTGPHSAREALLDELSK